jgi:hypothetical protein
MKIIDLFSNIGFTEAASNVTIEVVKRVLCVPDKAFKALMGDCGINRYNPSDVVEEDALEYFSNAYIRKIKNYFVTSSSRFLALSQDEKDQFKRFCRIFKKDELELGLTFSWHDIDIHKIREAFYQEIEKAAKEKSLKYLHESSEDTSSSLGKYIAEQRLSNYTYALQVIDKVYYPRLFSDQTAVSVINEALAQEEKHEILTYIREKEYMFPRVEEKPFKSDQASKKFDIIYTFARYHIFSSEKGDCHIRIA